MIGYGCCTVPSETFDFSQRRLAGVLAQPLQATLFARLRRLCERRYFDANDQLEFEKSLMPE